ncbi:MAG TPA: transposase [bacterium]|jgi:REP element-mobilizing transposase RayT
MPKSRSTGVPPVGTPVSHRKITNIKIWTRGFIPHWELQDSIYFVTFRLHDSIPPGLIEKLAIQCRQAVFAHQDNLEKKGLSVNKRINNLMRKNLDIILDKGYGSQILKEQELAEIVSKAMKFFDGDRYELYAWVVMPTHVHVLLKLIGDNHLSDIMHSWKSFTSKKINKILGKSGSVWQREYFDRIVRDEDDFRTKLEYIINNPAKAGLDDWKWVWSIYDEAKIESNLDR